MVATEAQALDEAQLVVVGTLLEEILQGKIRDETRNAVKQVMPNPRDLPTPFNYIASYCEGSRQDGKELAHSLQIELADILDHMEPK